MSIANSQKVLTSVKVSRIGDLLFHKQAERSESFEYILIVSLSECFVLTFTSHRYISRQCDCDRMAALSIDILKTLRTSNFIVDVWISTRLPTFYRFIDCPLCWGELDGNLKNTLAGFEYLFAFKLYYFRRSSLGRLVVKYILNRPFFVPFDCQSTK